MSASFLYSKERNRENEKYQYLGYLLVIIVGDIKTMITVVNQIVKKVVFLI